jgi:hypothetical protein
MKTKKINSTSKAILSFLMFALTISVLGSLAASYIGIGLNACVAIIAVAFVVSAAYNAFKNKGVANDGSIVLNAIQQEFWVNYIIGNLFKDNSFLMKCFDESDSVLAGSVVHIPQAGAKPTVVKNRSSFPATMVKRTDTDITYPLDVYSTDPTLITNAEEKEISYNKIDSVLGEHVSSLNESFSDDLLFKWAPTLAGNIINTTGDSVATALAPSATGNRNKFTKEDLKAAQRLMNKQNIAKEDRYALCPTDLYAQLMEDKELIRRDGVMGGEIDLKEGIVLRLFGFALMERSDTTVYDVTNAPKAPAASGTTTDNMAVICWQKNAVAKAMGSAKFFESIGLAENYGDTYSAEIKLGGRSRRANGAGVVAIVQGGTPTT